jgi:hypothetical protein
MSADPSIGELVRELGPWVYLEYANERRDRFPVDLDFTADQGDES